MTAVSVRNLQFDFVSEQILGAWKPWQCFHSVGGDVFDLARTQFKTNSTYRLCGIVHVWHQDKARIALFKIENTDEYMSGEYVLMWWDVGQEGKVESTGMYGATNIAQAIASAGFCEYREPKQVATEYSTYIGDVSQWYRWHSMDEIMAELHD